jgi:SAM-dependent methyltransferase
LIPTFWGANRLSSMSVWNARTQHSILAFPMNQENFEWAPDFWQGWRESSNPYRRYKSERDRRLVLKSLEPCDHDRVLEVGCGYGWISEALWNSANIEWTGVDRADAMIHRLRAAHPERGAGVLLADACRLPFRENEFDKVLCSGVLMHISDNATAVRELIRVLRPGGRLVCSINNALSPFSVPARLWNWRKRGFVQKFQLPQLFRQLLRNEGLQLDGMAGDGIIATVPLSIGRLHFPPVSVSSLVCRRDEWVANLFPWLAYEVWFRGVKAIAPCAS